jgi:membrane protease subunit HflK
MIWQNQSGGGGNKNPWGRPPGNGGGNNGGPRNPWGGTGRGGNNGGGADLPPNLDDMLRKAQDNLRRALPGNIGTGSFIGLIVAAILVLWLLSGLYILEPGVHGVVQRFGALTSAQTSEGLHYHLPWPVEKVEKVNVSQMRRMAIGSAGGTQRVAGDLPEESLMLTSDANIVELDLIVLWNVKSAENYLFNIEEPEQTIRKVAQSAIREVVGQTTMLPIITNARTQVADKAREIMQQNLDSYKSGISISQVLIQQAEVHPDVQDAFQDVQSAKQDAINVQNQAETYRQDILPKARGQAIQLRQNASAYRESAVARATGEAKRFESVYESYLLGKDVTKDRLYIETMENVLGRATSVIADDKASGGVVPWLPLNDIKPAAGTAAVLMDKAIGQETQP